MEQINEKIGELLTLISGKPTTGQILVSLTVALGLAALQCGAYRLANRKESYDPRFESTLAALALMSTVLMELVQSNLALSLGMLGSLSIVRFRTSIKDPRDIGFIFWSMAIGLAASTGSYFIGLAGSIVLGILMISTSNKRQAGEMMLVVRGSTADIQTVGEIVSHGSAYHQVQAKNVMSDSFELVYEVRLSGKEGDSLIGQLLGVEGIDSVNLLAEAKAA